jgi:hypothetical protein
MAHELDHATAAVQAGQTADRRQGRVAARRARQSEEQRPEERAVDSYSVTCTSSARIFQMAVARP